MTEVREINIMRPNPPLIRQLKKMLEYAEEGRIVGIAGVVYYHDGGTAEHWQEPPKTYSESLTADRMQGCLSRLSFMLHCRSLGIDINDFVDSTDQGDADPEAS